MDKSKEKNDIYELQNKDSMQELLVVQHFTYRKAKKMSGLLFLLSVFIPILINIALIIISNYQKIVEIISFSSIIIFIICEIIRSYIEKLKCIAAKIQEIFDTELFGIRSICNIEDDQIQKYVEKYKNKTWERSQNWYQNYSELDKNKAIFYCQKENIDWTNNLSKKYEKFILFVISISIIIFCYNFIIYIKSSFSLISILTIILPLFRYCYSSICKMKHDNISILSIKNFISIIDSCIKNNKINDKDLFDKINRLQWMIFMYRKDKYLIPDWFDKLHYKNLENIEKRKSKNVKKR